MDCLKKMHDICFKLFQKNGEYLGDLIYLHMYVYHTYIWHVYLKSLYNTFINNIRGANPEMLIRSAPYFDCNIKSRNKPSERTFPHLGFQTIADFIT